MIDRRNFLKLLMAAPAVKAIDVIVPEKEKMPKAILVDPYRVNMKDIEHADIPTKIIRTRRPAWGQGEPITRIF